MSDIELTLKIPEELARQAESIGLLSNERIIDLLQGAIDNDETRRQQAIIEMRAIISDLQTVEPPMTEAEVEAAIREARKRS